MDLQQVLDSIPHLIVLSDAFGHVRKCNKRWKEYVGEEQQKEDPSWLSAVHPSEFANAKQKWELHISSLSQPYEISHRLRGRDGEHRYGLVVFLVVLSSFFLSIRARTSKHHIILELAYTTIPPIGYGEEMVNHRVVFVVDVLLSSFLCNCAGLHVGHKEDEGTSRSSLSSSLCKHSFNISK